ncbi:MAG: hypothetical protein MI747_12555, partial [Desulfobacterales bacterium]|nr:hypothetical protein [Desulfobacterales bacterium]
KIVSPFPQFISAPGLYFGGPGFGCLFHQYPENFVPWRSFLFLDLVGGRCTASRPFWKGG